MNAKELRKKFLKDAAPVIEHMVAEATGGKSALVKGHIVEEKFREVWNAIVPMMQAENDVVKANAKTTTDVIKAVSDGKITIREAKELMGLLREQQEIDVLPELLEKLEEVENEK